MLTVYLDESMETGDSYVVVAGFMGNKTSWVKCMKKWKAVLRKHGRTAIHLKELRLKERHRDLLKSLGDIPEACGLRLIFGAVNIASYKPDVAGTVMEATIPGYIYAFSIALMSALHSVPNGQRLEVICEDQREFNDRRSNVCIATSMMPEFINRNGKSKLAKWSSMMKSTILEPSDYVSFALLQKIRDRAKGHESLKSSLCSPIPKNKLMSGKVMSGAAIIAEILAENPTLSQSLLTPDQKKVFIRNMPTGDEFKKGFLDQIMGGLKDNK